MTQTLLAIENLSVGFRHQQTVRTVVNDVSLHIESGETLALVGESGSGKSVTALSILRLLPSPPVEYLSGDIRFHGESLLHASEQTLRGVRGNKIAMIFQEPMVSLNPLHTLEKQLYEVLSLHRGMRREAARGEILNCLDRVGIRQAAKRLTDYPHQLSPQATEVTVLEGKTMGTFWRVSIPGIDAKRSAELKEKIQTQLDADDQLLSTYKKDSALMRFNDSQSLTPWPVNEALADIVTTSLRIGAKTEGAMDITVGPLVNLWGFGPEQQPVQIPSQEQIDAMKAKTGLQHLTVINKYHQQYLQKDLPDLYVDLSTVGEGYAADHLARLMEQEGISRYLVSVGGALNSRGMNGEGLSWRVAIQKPTDKENAVQAVVDINGHGISTSGSYRNYYELDGKRLSHVIDPQTGRPIEHNLVSVTVIAPTALEADAWDTGLMVLGPDKAKEVVRREGLAVYMITKEGDNFKTWMSPQFKSFLVSEKN